MAAMADMVVRSLVMIDKIKQANNDQVAMFIKDHPWMAFFVSYKGIVGTTIGSIMVIIGWIVKAHL